MYRLVASSSRVDGQFLFSTHHHGIRQRLRREKRIDIIPIRIRISFARTLGISSVRLSRLLEGVPIVELLGELLLCAASSPRI